MNVVHSSNQRFKQKAELFGTLQQFWLYPEAINNPSNNQTWVHQKRVSHLIAFSIITAFIHYFYQYVE